MVMQFWILPLLGGPFQTRRVNKYYILLYTKVTWELLFWKSRLLVVKVSYFCDKDSRQHPTSFHCFLVPPTEDARSDPLRVHLLLPKGHMKAHLPNVGMEFWDDLQYDRPKQLSGQVKSEEISNNWPGIHSQLGDWIISEAWTIENKVLALYLGSSWNELWCDWPHVTYFHANKNDKWYVFLPPTGERRSDLYMPTQSEERTNEANQVKTSAWVPMSFKRQQTVVKKNIYMIK